MTAGQLLVVVVAGLVTYAIRASFLVVADRMVDLPERVTTVLRMIMPAVLAAIVVPALLRPGGGGLDPISPVMVGAIAAALMSLWKNNIGLSLLVGLTVVLAARPLLG